jgi:hypothetical protein
VGYRKGERTGVTYTSMYSLWFDRFIAGCHTRRGDDIRPDRAMCIELLIEIQRELEEDLERCETLEDMLNVSRHGMCVVIRFLCRAAWGGSVKSPHPQSRTRTYRPTRPESHSGQSSPITCVCYCILEQDYGYIITLVMKYLLYSIFYPSK